MERVTNFSPTFLQLLYGLDLKHYNNSYNSIQGIQAKSVNIKAKAKLQLILIG